MPTVSANGLTLCHAGSGGVAMATVPDVCKTQVGNSVVPIPYPNIAEDKDLVDGSESVTAEDNPIAIEGCKFSKSTGDESGSIGGVSSGITQGEAAFILFSPDVKVEGKAVARLTDMMTMNKENAMCMGGILIPPVGPVIPPEPAEIQIDPLEKQESGTIQIEIDHEAVTSLMSQRYQLTSSDDSYMKEKTAGSAKIEGTFARLVFKGCSPGLEYTLIIFDDGEDTQGEIIFEDIPYADLTE